MSYPFAVKTPQRTAIFTEPTGWGNKRLDVYRQTDISVVEEWIAHAHDTFNNDFHRTKKALFDRRATTENSGGYALLTRDRVRNGGRGTNDRGSLHVLYISHEGTKYEKKDYVWCPKPGFVVPTGDDMIKTTGGVVIWMPYQGRTGIPRETVSFDKREAALNRLESRGIPAEQLSGFHRPDNYDIFENEGGSMVSCDFFPNIDEDGRFNVDADKLPSAHGLPWLASRPGYDYKGQPLLRQLKVLITVKKFQK